MENHITETLLMYTGEYHWLWWRKINERVRIYEGWDDERYVLKSRFNVNCYTRKLFLYTAIIFVIKLEFSIGLHTMYLSLSYAYIVLLLRIYSLSFDLYQAVNETFALLLYFFWCACPPLQCSWMGGAEWVGKGVPPAPWSLSLPKVINTILVPGQCTYTLW